MNSGHQKASNIENNVLFTHTLCSSHRGVFAVGSESLITDTGRTNVFFFILVQIKAKVVSYLFVRMTYTLF